MQTQTREVQLTETATTRPSDTPTHALSPDLGLFLAQTQTFEAQLAELARLTNTPPPTLLPAEGLALTPVVNNADWTPYERDFDGVAMVLVPAGCFMMGSTDAQIDDAYSAYVTEYGENFDMRGLFETESPQHEQCFETPFWVDKYEVTQVQFRQFNGQKVNENGFTGDDLPVEQITWFEARDYCEW
ncbi:MAG: SUMF1/EgtB/PvdO family nonheme iron enzyme [bacterium]|nr:SUMF1/EgtB/PvdO family nonheme iron enzyme [bacterium]